MIDELKSAFTTKLSDVVSPIVIVPPNVKLPSMFTFPVTFKLEPEITPKLTFWLANDATVCAEPEITPVGNNGVTCALPLTIPAGIEDILAYVICEEPETTVSAFNFVLTLASV